MPHAQPDLANIPAAMKFVDSKIIMGDFASILYLCLPIGGSLPCCSRYGGCLQFAVVVAAAADVDDAVVSTDLVAVSELFLFFLSLLLLLLRLLLLLLLLLPLLL